MEIHDQLIEKQICVEISPLDNKPEKKSNRSIFTDWMRNIGIYYVVTVHILVSLKRTVKIGMEPGLKIDSYFRQILQFGLPLFFYFSGRAATFSNDKPLIYLKKKCMRLLIPLVAGTILIVIPTAYIGREYRPQHNTDPNMPFWKFFILYFPQEFPKNGFEWLWFLPVLFFISLMNYPFVVVAKRVQKRQGGRILEEDRYYCMGLLIALGAIWLVIGILKPVWIVIAILGTIQYLILGYLLHNLQFLRDQQILEVLFGVNATLSIILAVCQKYLSGYDDFMMTSVTFIMYNYFYVEATLDQIFEEEFQVYRNNEKHKKLKPIALFLLILFLAVCAPGTSYKTGSFWNYPMYEDPLMRGLYVLGGWLWILLVLKFCQQLYNETLDDRQYNFLLRSTMLTYLFHWLFLEIANRYFVYEYKLSLFTALIIVVPFTLIGCFITYLVISYIPAIGIIFGIDPSTFKKKKKKDTDLSQQFGEPQQA